VVEVFDKGAVIALSLRWLKDFVTPEASCKRGWNDGNDDEKLMFKVSWN